MSRPDRHRELEARYLAELLVSCPDCGTLCRRDRSTGGVFDLNPPFVPWDAMPEWVLDAVDRQGLGVHRGGLHRCPPTLSVLTPDETPTPVMEAAP